MTEQECKWLEDLIARGSKTQRRTKRQEIEEVLERGAKHVEETDGEARKAAAIAAIYSLVGHTALMLADYIDNEERGNFHRR